jgi:hypothetical protein
MRSIQHWQKTLSVALLLAIGVTQAKDGDAAASNATCGQAAASMPSGSMMLNAAVQHIACQSVNRRLLIVGELHGTNETPALVAALVKATSKDRPIRVGVEWPAWMQDYVATYLASQGTLDDRKAMLSMKYWGVVLDGRGSEAMINLIDAIRVLRESGRDIEIFVMEPDVPITPSDLQSNPLTWKENGMTKALKTALSTAPSNALVVAYMGSVHSRYITRADHSQPSVLQQVMSNHPLYILVDADAGSSWNCQAGGCGPHMFKAYSKPPSQDVEINPLSDAPEGITAEILNFSIFTPSVPAPRFKDPDSKARN